jgi:hypothetical protein
MEKLIILFLTLLVTPLFAYDKAADKLDLTLPETPFDYEQMNEDSLLIQQAINERFRFVKIKNEPSKRTLRTFYILNAIDMSTSYYMTRSHPTIKEANFLLPEKPTAAEFLIHKSVIVPITAANFEEGQMVAVNWVLGFVILHNLYLYNNTCKQTANYHHVTGQNINPC